jgi:hypothetical protein
MPEMYAVVLTSIAGQHQLQISSIYIELPPTSNHPGDDHAVPEWMKLLSDMRGMTAVELKTHRGEHK